MALSKIELFDPEVMQKLLRHEGISKSERESLKSYKKRSFNGNQVTIAYDYGKSIRDYKKGRLYPQPYLGLAAFSSNLRAALAQTNYDEFDMANSQPTLIQQFAEKEGLPSVALTEFVEKRKEILAQLQKDHNMTRDEAKQLCFSVFYGFYVDSHPLFPQLRKEMDALSLRVMEKYPEFVEIAKKSKESKDMNPTLHANLQGSTLAHYAQHIETQILLEADDFLKSKNYQVDVLQHDGGCVRKRDGESIPLSVLKELDQHIEKTLGYKVTFTIKPLIHTFDFSQVTESKILPSSIHINDSFAAEQFVKLAGDRIRKVGTELYVLNDDDIWRSDEDAMRSLIAEYESKLIWKQYGDQGNIRTYDYGGMTTNIVKLITQTRVKAKPGDLPIQFAFTNYEPAENAQEIIERFLHLLHLVSGKNQDVQTYLLKWIAHILQKPLILPRILVILTGDKGIGKDTLFDFLMEYVLGEYSATNYDSNQQFFEKHDIGRKGKLLVKLEEANRKFCIDNKDELKPMVTAANATFNPKNGKIVTVPNYCRFVFTTNKGNPVDFGGGERRFIIIPCSADMKGNTEYWDTTHSLLFSKGAGRVIGDLLMNIDLSDFNPAKLPANEYQDDVIESEESPESIFIRNWDGEPLSMADFFDKYRNYCQENDLPYCNNRVAFGKKLIDFVRDKKVLKIKKNTGTFYGK